MHLSSIAKAVVVLFAASQVTATASRRQTTDVSSIPAACESTCEPLFDFQSECATEESANVAKCLCVPEFVTYSKTCSSCVVENTAASTNTTARIQKGIDDALEEFLSVCKDELGVDLTTVNSFAPTNTGSTGNSTSTETGISDIGPAAAAGVNPDSIASGTIRVDIFPLKLVAATIGAALVSIL
ncbi:hypothetical protein MD484_g8033, partial [Candolleomyces efflorescens]